MVKFVNPEVSPNVIKEESNKSSLVARIELADLKPPSLKKLIQHLVNTSLDQDTWQAVKSNKELFNALLSYLDEKFTPIMVAVFRRLPSYYTPEDIKGYSLRAIYMLMMRFNPKLSNSIYGYINAYIKFRVIDQLRSNATMTEQFKSYKDRDKSPKVFNLEERLEHIVIDHRKDGIDLVIDRNDTAYVLKLLRQNGMRQEALVLRLKFLKGLSYNEIKKETGLCYRSIVKLISKASFFVRHDLKK